MPKSPIVRESNGRCVWIGKESDTYIVTGHDCAGKRFRKTGTWDFVRAVNACRGSRWLLRDGKRYLIERVW